MTGLSIGGPLDWRCCQSRVDSRSEDTRMILRWVGSGNVIKIQTDVIREMTGSQYSIAAALRRGTSPLVTLAVYGIRRSTP